jgi:putative PIN family toxin of toxin-antitoxin system
MRQKSLKVFLDTSVIIAAVLSPAGGARALFYLGEAGLLKLIIGPNVLRETDEVVRRKVPGSLPLLAQLLAVGQVATVFEPSKQQVETAQHFVQYSPDAFVLAEAIQAQPDWFVTHDKDQFLKRLPEKGMLFKTGTPGDLLQKIKDNYNRK